MNQLAQPMKAYRKLRIKRFVLYLIKWQCGTPVIYLCMTGLPVQSNIIKTILANVIGAFIFYPIDMALFTKKAEGKTNGNSSNEKTTV